MPLSLDTLAADRFRLTPPQRAALGRLGIKTIRDLLYHFPVRYGDTVAARSIETLQKGDTAVIFGKITGLKASKGFRTKMTMATGVVEDETGKIHCVWFNQPYLAKMTPEGAFVRVEGKVSQRRGKTKAAPAGEVGVSRCPETFEVEGSRETLDEPRGRAVIKSAKYSAIRKSPMEPLVK